MSRNQIFRRFAHARVLIAVTPLLSGCYLIQQGAGIIAYQIEAEPIAPVLESGSFRGGASADAQMLDFLREVERVRRFAADDLGLDVGRNYSRIVLTDRDYLAAVVNAVGELDFTRHQWRWPFAGRFPYKGFFDPAGARREADRLRERGYDVWVRPVDAFSTLGITSDPVFSFMVDYPPHRIAELIVHESVHATIYLRNQGQFNEELATWIGIEGAIAYLERYYGPASDELAAYDAARADARTFRADMFGLRDALEPIYRALRESRVSADDARTQKADAIAGFQEWFAAAYDERYRSDAFRRIAEIPINNAYLDLVATYAADLDLYERLAVAASRDGAARRVERIRALVDLVLGFDRSRATRRDFRRDPKAFLLDWLERQ